MVIAGVAAAAMSSLDSALGAMSSTTVWDFYSTVLHLLGLDYEKLSFYHNGIDQRLTDVHGGVVKQVLA